jgi:hypothetical protein
MASVGRQAPSTFPTELRCQAGCDEAPYPYGFAGIIETSN